MTAARIGPNAILQTDAALTAFGGPDLAQRVFEAAGLAALRRSPPQEMVGEDLAARLMQSVVRVLPPGAAGQVTRRAGELTGAYILQNRIPAPARLLLRALPAPLAGPLLLRAIERHAWTFAGSGAVRTEPGPPMILEIRANPIAQPGCPWHIAVFETLFRSLVHPRIAVHHPFCCATGAPACRFEIARD